MTISLTISGDDPKFPAVIAAIAGTAAPTTGGTSGGTTTGAPSGGTTTPSFTMSPVPSVLVAPVAVNGASSGILTDSQGTTFSYFYGSAGEWYQVVVNGTFQPQGAGGNVMYLLPNASGKASDPPQVWLQNPPEGSSQWALWEGGNFVFGQTAPTIPAVINIIFPLPIPVVAPPPGSVTPGATPVTATATGMEAAITAAVAGSTVTLTAGVYTETALVSQPITVTGAGIGKTILNCQGVVPTFQKAVLVPNIAGVTIENLSITGAAIDNGSGGNAAGVRDGANGDGFILNEVEVFGCQMGLLTFASPIVVGNSHIHNNGNATAPSGTHNIYVGGGTLALTNSVVEHCAHEHEVKSRATSTTIAGCTITTAGNGKCIDICDGGAVAVSNTTLQLGVNVVAGNQDLGFFDYGTESLNNGQGSIVFTNVVFDSSALGDQSGLLIVGSFAPAATITLTGCTWKGAAPQFQGIAAAQITGTIAPAA